MEDANHIIPFPAEVIDLIFDQIEAKGRDEALANFANLARSCRTFTEPALNRLWKVQGNLAPLIQCIPEDLWNITVDENTKEVELTFQRAIAETDWTRFEYYQWRVHEFGIGGDISGTRLNTYDVHPDVLRTLTTYQPAKVFLPNLQRWTANDNAKKLLPFAGAFIGPKLTHIVMEFIDSPPDTLGVFTLLSSLAHLSVDLQSLEFACDGNNNFYDSLFDLAMHLPNLHRLVIPYVSSEVLAHLSRLPFLEVFSRVELQDEGDIHLFITQDGRFPSLKELDISVPDYTAACALLKVLQHPLESLTLTILRNRPVDISTRWTHFTQALSMLEQYHRFSLRKLVIYTPTNRTNTSRQVTPDAFAPLYSFQSLQHLILATPFSLHLDDVWLAHAIMFWPLLRVLRIIHRSKTRGSPNFTLKGLIPLMKGCPQLSELSLPLNLKPVAISSLEGASNWHIRYLCITPGSSLILPRRVFRSLITMFPNLISLVLTGNTPDVTENDWQELLGLFQMFWPVDEDEEQG